MKNNVAIIEMLFEAIRHRLRMNYLYNDSPYKKEITFNSKISDKGIVLWLNDLKISFSHLPIAKKDIDPLVLSLTQSRAIDNVYYYPEKYSALEIFNLKDLLYEEDWSKLSKRLQKFIEESQPKVYVMKKSAFLSNQIGK